ncbi:hypothetical protein D3C71_1874980 [compost metagenome]
MRKIKKYLIGNYYVIGNYNENILNLYSLHYYSKYKVMFNSYSFVNVLIDLEIQTIISNEIDLCIDLALRGNNDE